MNFIQSDLNEFREQFQKISHENLLFHERTSQTTVKSTDVYVDSYLIVESRCDEYSLHSSENIVRHAELVVEENKVLQDQLQLQTNRLTTIQKSQLEEGENKIKEN